MRNNQIFDAMKDIFGLIMMCIAIMSFAACQSQHAQTLPKPTPPAKKTLEDQSVTLTAGDVIELKFPYAQQFNEQQSIRPDGKIMLSLIGMVKAAGKTPESLRKVLMNKYKEHLKHPEVAVIVRLSYQRKVFIGGEVNKPGQLDIPGDLSVMEAVMQAGGFNMDKAEVSNVVVIRQIGKKRQSYALNLRQSLKGKPRDPFYLQSNDIVYVPRTKIANVNQWVQQHIYGLLPPVVLSYPLD